VIVSKMESHGGCLANMREELLALQGDVLVGTMSSNVLSKVKKELIDANAFHKMNRYLFKFKDIIDREKRKKMALNIEGPWDETKGGGCFPQRDPVNGIHNVEPMMVKQIGSN